VEETASAGPGSRVSRLSTSGLGGLLGGLVGGLFVVGVTLLLKAGLDFVSARQTWLIIVAPLLGLVVTTLVLHGIGRAGEEGRTSPWRSFPRRAVRSDITGDVVASAGEEERFPWRLAPLRALAIFATVGSGGAMGTEAPAAYLGVAAGAALGDRGRWWRRLLRPAALGGGAAGVAALMGIPLVGTGYMLELGHQHRAPVDGQRAMAALVGGLVGWALNHALHLDLIRLIKPKEPPITLAQAVITALFIGATSGAITALAAAAIGRAKKWKASPVVRLVLGGTAAVATALLLVTIAAPATAVGPGGGAILWAESAGALPRTLLAVALLRAAATTATVAAGGCGGVFVPFLAVGDIAGRVFAPGLGVGNDLAGAAGAAAGIAGGYRLPFTAAAMVLGLGGPPTAMLTCLVTALIAFAAGVATDAVLGKLGTLSAVAKPAVPAPR
jgi:CIC family chloride channel protein